MTFRADSHAGDTVSQWFRGIAIRLEKLIFLTLVGGTGMFSASVPAGRRSPLLLTVRGFGPGGIRTEISRRFRIGKV